MPTSQISRIVQHLHRKVGGPAANDMTDGNLLESFLARREEAAFEALVQRHGPMVLGVCRRVLGNTHDAEEAFQAAFLVLVRKAASITQRELLGSWLYSVAYRSALTAKSKRTRRNSCEKQVKDMPHPVVDPNTECDEFLPLLDRELSRLPDKYRIPVVLCELEGRSRSEVASHLDLPEGTLSSRLATARKLLAKRLSRHGLAVSGGALAAVLAPSATSACLPASLLSATVSASVSVAVAKSVTAGAVSASVAALIKGVLKAMLLTRLKIGAALLLPVFLLTVGTGLLASRALMVAQADPLRKADEKKEDAIRTEETKRVSSDDPLPAGSTLRFGTSRFRYGTSVKTLAISPDGKTAFVANDSGIPRAFDLVSGRVLFSLNRGSVEAGVYSPDGRTLVLKQGFDLCVFDAANGKELRTIKGARKNLRHSGVPVFTPDGKAVATISDGNDVHLIDFESGNTIRDFVHEIPKSGSPSDFGQVNAIAFSADGKLMATGGYGNEKGNYFARLWEVETGKELRRFMHGEKGYGIGSLTFSPDGRTLATLGTQGGVFLRLFDVDTGKERRAFPKDGELRPSPGSVAFSPDGKTVAAALTSIHLYDTTTGEERLRIDRRASVLHFTDDGKTLTAAVSGAIYRWDTTTGKTLTPEAADSTVEQILVSADGTRVITRGQNSDGYIWDGATGKLLRRIPVAYYRGLAISPDGRFLAWPVDDDSVQFKDPQQPGSTFYGSRIRLYDLAADKVVDRFPSFKGSAQDLAFTNDGKNLVTVESYGGMVRIWDFEGGKEERSFHAVPDALKKQFYNTRTLLSPDGKTVVKCFEEDTGGRLGMRARPQFVRHWDVASGKELPQLNGGTPIDRAFSPDGRLVVTRGGNHVCEIATGRRVGSLPDDPMLYIRAAAFSRDGRFLATTVPGDVMQIWEVATWTKQLEFKGHRDEPTTLAFTPGGQLLSGSRDTTVLAWDLRPPRPALKVSLDNAWIDLAKRESAEAFKAEGSFLAAAPDAINFFADKIKPEEPLDVKRVQRLLADLDSDQFAQRDAASKALTELGNRVKPYLEETIKTTKSTEVQDRAKKILEALQAAAATPQLLRQMRAVLVLELIGDQESKDLLSKWASGPVGALLTEEAAAALKRLQGVAKAKL